MSTAGPAAALPGQQTVVARVPYQSSSSVTLDAVCPAGLRVIGGGGSIGPQLGPDKVFLTQSYPINQSTWRVRAAEVAPGWDGQWALNAFAICANPLNGYEIVKGNSGPGVATFKTTYTPTCADHKKVFSAGGAVIDAPVGQVGLTMIRPDGPLTIGRASARVAPAGYWGSWSVNSYAICANPVPGLAGTSAIAADRIGLVVSCPSGQRITGPGGGGGLIDLGPYYLQELAPVADQGVTVRMTGLQQGGTLAQVTCSAT
ncbi:hypothetical protein [Krasilnikovia sp. MM14-A1004]|uniref:hypothetical protein n=1 Tax=Krasilnikovia sp. MM14-A1004 TaxID=3373541 RepID=UPI00399D4CA1